MLLKTVFLFVLLSAWLLWRLYARKITIRFTHRHSDNSLNDAVANDIPDSWRGKNILF